MSPVNESRPDTCNCQLPLAIASVPKQPWVQPSELNLALKRGTIFENLYFPFFIGGEDHA